MKKGSKNSPNKSQIIRDAAAKNPNAKAAEIAKLLASQGVTVSIPLVYQALRGVSANGTVVVKKRGRPAGSKKSAKAPTTSAKASTASASGSSILESALDFVKQSGSIEKAIQALTLLKQIG